MRHTRTLSSSYTSSVPMGLLFGSAASSAISPPGREGSTERVSWRAMSYVGAALSPRETKKLVLGRGSYIGDLTAPGLLHAAFVRSPHAHARIRHLHRQEARVTAPLRIAPPIEGLLPMEMATLPTDKVRFVGDPVACVVGDQRYQ